MQTMHESKKLNNKGFTLVELLVAMVILGIIVGPMLHAFITASFMNAKARKNFNSYTVAEDIAEGIKSNTIEELSKMTNYPANLEDPFNLVTNDLFTSGSPSATNVCELEVDPSGTDTYKKITTPHTNEDTSVTPATYEFTKSTDGKYYYYVGGLKPSDYDSLIILDASPYQAGGSAGVKYNEKEIVTFAAVKGDNNAVFLQKKTDFDMSGRNAGEALYNMARDANPSVSPAIPSPIPMDNIYRTIRINVKKYQKGSPAEDYKKVTVTYEYSFAGATYVTAGPDLNISTIYDKKVSEVDLDNVYVFFQPMYLSTSGVVRDKIIIENADNIPVDIYLIKQQIDISKYATETSVSGSLAIAEGSYYAMVDVETTGGSAASSLTKIHTNLGESFEINPLTNKRDKYTNQVGYKYRNINTNQLKVTDLSAKEALDRYFDVTVKLFPKGRRTGDSFDFKEDDKLYEIQGSTLE